MKLKYIFLFGCLCFAPEFEQALRKVSVCRLGGELFQLEVDKDKNLISITDDIRNELEREYFWLKGSIKLLLGEKILSPDGKDFDDIPDEVTKLQITAIQIEPTYEVDSKSNCAKDGVSLFFEGLEPGIYSESDLVDKEVAWQVSAFDYFRFENKFHPGLLRFLQSLYIANKLVSEEFDSANKNFIKRSESLTNQFCPGPESPVDEILMKEVGEFINQNKITDRIELTINKEEWVPHFSKNLWRIVCVDGGLFFYGIFKNLPEPESLPKKVTLDELDFKVLECRSPYCLFSYARFPFPIPISADLITFSTGLTHELSKIDEVLNSLSYKKLICYALGEILDLSWEDRRAYQKYNENHPMNYLRQAFIKEMREVYEKCRTRNLDLNAIGHQLAGDLIKAIEDIYPEIIKYKT